MRTLAPVSPGPRSGATTVTASAPDTFAHPGAGRDVATTWATCGVRVSTACGAATVPALAGCSVATTRTSPPTIGAPRVESVSVGTTSADAVAVTPSAEAVH